MAHQLDGDRKEMDVVEQVVQGRAGQNRAGRQAEIHHRALDHKDRVNETPARPKSRMNDSKLSRPRDWASETRPAAQVAGRFRKGPSLVARLPWPAKASRPHSPTFTFGFILPRHGHHGHQGSFFFVVFAFFRKQSSEIFHEWAAPATESPIHPSFLPSQP